MHIQAVLWDLDGTLISTRSLYFEAYRRALKPYIGRDMSDDEIMAQRARSEIRFLQAHAADRYDECWTDFRRHYAELHGTHFGGIYPGVLETLQALRARGLPMGIVTGKSRSSYEVSIANADLGPFDVLVLDDDVTQPKPSPEGILAAVAALRLPAANVLYVGDSVSDATAALAAGTRAAAALWSKRDRERDRFVELLRTEGDVLLLDQPADLLEFTA